MSASSWNCAGCRNLCHMMGSDGVVATYCRTIYDQPKHKGTKWVGDKVICLDYTSDPGAEDQQVRIWEPPKYAKPVRFKNGLIVE